MRKKLAMMLATLKKKRPFYTEVEYLETKNQQTNDVSTNAAAYIDTGIIPNNNTRIECRMQFTTLISGQNKEALSGITGPESAPRFAWGFASISPYTNFYFGLGAQNLTTSVTRDTNVHTFVLDAKNKTCSIDNTTQSFTSSGSLNGQRSIYLFARHTTVEYANRPCNAKVYCCKIWDNDVLVRDMIPVLDWNYVPCMYDRITEQLFYNAGTGDFVAGRQIHPVEYIESTGTQYIDTGVKLSSTSKVECSAEYTGVPTSGSSYLFGVYDNNKNFGLNSALRADPPRWFGVWYNQGTLTSYTVFTGLNTKYDVEVSSNGIYVNGELMSSVSGTFTGTANAYLFWANGTTQPKSIMKMYRCKMWNSNNMVRDFIPAIDENDTFFMFDKITHTTYNNSGSGSFIGPTVEKDENGKIVEPEYE